MSKHTPGPWSVTPRFNNMIDVIHSQGKTPGSITLALCRVQARQSWIAEAEANARLIAAAPELLQALQGMVRQFGYEVVHAQGLVHDEHEALRAAIAAIAKATGEAA